MGASADRSGAPQEPWLRAMLEKRSSQSIQCRSTEIVSSLTSIPPNACETSAPMPGIGHVISRWSEMFQNNPAIRRQSFRQSFGPCFRNSLHYKGGCLE